MTRELARFLFITAGAVPFLLPPQTGVAQEVGYRKAVDQLAQEKTLAESCASILKTFADNDPMVRI